MGKSVNLWSCCFQGLSVGLQTQTSMDSYIYIYLNRRGFFKSYKRGGTIDISLSAYA